MDETIHWHDTRKEGLPKESGNYLVTMEPGIFVYKSLDLQCPHCVEHWQQYYVSWAEKPKGWVP